MLIGPSETFLTRGSKGLSYDGTKDKVKLEVSALRAFRLLCCILCLHPALGCGQSEKGLNEVFGTRSPKTQIGTFCDYLREGAHGWVEFCLLLLPL